MIAVKCPEEHTLFTRPRRFGKTLALSMLRTFFELEYDRDGNIAGNRVTKKLTSQKALLEGFHTSIVKRSY